MPTDRVPDARPAPPPFPAGGFARLGALSALLAVALGAFGAHGLEGRASAADLDTWETAARYQMYHALGLFVVAWLSDRGAGRRAALAGWLFVVGSVVFSGSLYALVLTGQRWLGAVTPLGGLAFLAGWAALALVVARRPGAGR